MKKILTIIIIAVFIAAMSLNIEITANANNENDIRIENTEALACYMIWHNGYMGDCCFPWWETCWVVDLYTTLPGTYFLPQTQ